LQTGTLPDLTGATKIKALIGLTIAIVVLAVADLFASYATGIRRDHTGIGDACVMSAIAFNGTQILRAHIVRGTGISGHCILRDTCIHWRVTVGNWCRIHLGDSITAH
jgi:hypothetical protein